MKKESRMSLFKKSNKTGGFIDEIRCDEPSYLIWKWHPLGLQSEKNNRENAIRWGSSLRVKEGEVAVFVYKQKNGIFQDFIEGPFDQRIQTANLPILSSIVGLIYEGGTPFQAEVYFINLARLIKVSFGVPFFDVYDPRFPDFSVPVAVRGTINFRIADYREFIRLHKLSTFRLEDFQMQIRSSINRYIKDIVANAPAVHDVPVIQLETKISQINDAVEYDIIQRMKEDFGVIVSSVDIRTIEIDKSSDGYAKLMAITQNATTATVKAQTAAEIKNIQEKQRIDMEDYGESLRIQRNEAQYARHKQTQSEHFASFQVEEQAKVGIAGAEALGKMNANGVGTVDFNGNGFNPAAMAAGLAVGSAVGQNIVGTMHRMMDGGNQLNEMTPPPVPILMYYVVVDGKAMGPYNIVVLKQMISSGTLTSESLVWTSGMSQWVSAKNVGSLTELFENDVPPIPQKN